MKARLRLGMLLALVELRRLGHLQLDIERSIEDGFLSYESSCIWGHSICGLSRHMSNTPVHSYF